MEKSTNVVPARQTKNNGEAFNYKGRKLRPLRETVPSAQNDPAYRTTYQPRVLRASFNYSHERTRESDKQLVPQIIREGKTVPHISERVPTDIDLSTPDDLNPNDPRIDFLRLNEYSSSSNMFANRNQVLGMSLTSQPVESQKGRFDGKSESSSVNAQDINKMSEDAYHGPKVRVVSKRVQVGGAQKFDVQKASMGMNDFEKSGKNLTVYQAPQTSTMNI